MFKSSRKSRNDVVSPKGENIKIERIETNAKTEGFFKFYNNEKRKKMIKTQTTNSQTYNTQ
jgi:hypothetical protein